MPHQYWRGEEVLLESGLYTPGNPFVRMLHLASNGLFYRANIHESLGRNAHFGFLRSRSNNDSSGVIQVRFTYDGQSWSDWFADIRVQETFSLDGMDIHTIEANGTFAGDQLWIVAW